MPLSLPMRLPALNKCHFAKSAVGMRSQASWRSMRGLRITIRCWLECCNPTSLNT